MQTTIILPLLSCTIILAIAGVCIGGRGGESTTPAINQAIARDLPTQIACPLTANAAENITITDSDPLQSISLNQNNILRVRLSSNPGTGYGWQLIENNPDLLKPLGEPILEPPNQAMLETPVRQLFQFQVLKAGESEVELQYRRPGESDRPPEQTYRFRAIAPNHPAIIRINDNDNGRGIRVVPGDDLIIRLITNRSTGHEWKWIESNQDFIQLQGQPTLQNREELMPGSPQEQVFHFRILSTGSSFLEFHYQRSQSDQPEKIYQFYIDTMQPDDLIQLTEANNENSVRLLPGNVLMVSLITNPSTGQSWQVVKNDPELLKPLNDPILVQIGNQYKDFCFQGQAEGTSVLEFHYSRPWEKDKPPLQIYRLNVQVENYSGSQINEVQ
ncbi:protease inhibitor I42 family protein [Laspinema olomoucense]|uniref:protease inhibitor I42 family protein n=1 Tax=Laspinema olomoucense TaxID=3231600 RepID=UPI0021BB8420|nr:protease inhibitor I42 family protein [Laspinema sp. D3c]MCT7997548.1 protease inhibitor I42 family protein [Laspinema sp. D3c]